MRKPLLIIGIIVILLIGGFFAFNSYIYNQKQAKDQETATPYRGTLTGEYVCLPHTDTNGPQTMECAFGIKTDVKEYYAVDFNRMSQNRPDMETGDRFTASGTITPIQLLSTDRWQPYPIVGIFSITDSVRKL